MIIEIEESVEKTVNRVNKGNWKIIVKEREKREKKGKEMYSDQGPFVQWSPRGHTHQMSRIV